ncbi:UNVERIFIED_CONTAM: hypothetical protein Slati_2406800 [Sesamum latifolium]|uniref:Myb/SANT-like domain-containing protein n=1 Tax=Sesamum latifolium TaxID=2727402 RepID=A0AAW2WCA2_9LAMI
MHEEFISHRLQSSTFSPSVWARITDRMNSTFCPSYVFTQEQLKGKLNMMRRAWRLLNDLLHKGTGWGWDHERNTVTDESEHLEELCREHHIRWHCMIVHTTTHRVTDPIDKLMKFKDLPDCVFTTALERFHSHSTQTIFLRLDDENKLRWLYSLAKTMASASEVAVNDTNSSSGSSETPGTPGSNESDVPEEFYSFRDLICPELFREKVPRNTSALQSEGWVAEMMATPHIGRFYDNIHMTKPCFYALVDALTSRGLLPHGKTLRVSSIEEVALFMQTVGMHKRQRDNMERFQHSLETIHRRFHRVLSALCAMAPELITRLNFIDTHPRVSSNTDFYPYFKDLAFHFSSNWQVLSSGCWVHKLPVFSCALLRFSHDDIIFNAPKDDIPSNMDVFYHRGYPTVTEIEAQRTLRDNITMQMWASYNPT